MSTQEEECCDHESCCDETEFSADSAARVCCSSEDEHCDEKCIIAAAALECEKTCETDVHGQNGFSSREHQHGGSDSCHRSSACSLHLAKAFEQYSVYLESARCICRHILGRGLTTACCAEQSRHHPVVASTSAMFTDPDDTGAHRTGQRNHRLHHEAHHHHEIRRPGPMVRQEEDGCCESDREGGCCGGHQGDHAVLEAGGKPRRPRSPGWDVEKAASQEHVVLAVNGMTCSGCGNKMERTLRAVAGVSSVHVNFVMSHAEFCVDTTVTSANEVIRAVERVTNFRCQRTDTVDQVLDVLASGTSAKALVNTVVPGLTSVIILNKSTVRMTYNPTMIGARKLFEAVQDLSTRLAPPRDDPSRSSARKRLHDQLAKTVVSAALTIPVVVLAWGHVHVADDTRAVVSIVLATMVQLIAVPDFYRPAIGALLHSFTVEMDMLVVISITAAYAYSVVAFGFRMADEPLKTPEFFETSTMLITLVLLGRLMAAFARIRAVNAVSLRSLQATTAVIVEDGTDKEIDARLLQYGDRIRIGPHSNIVTDGIVISGSSEVDESMLTGESVPVFKREGDAVIAGTVNGTGTMVAMLTRLPGENTVTDIAKLVEDAQQSKPLLQDYADKVAGWFVPIVTSVCVVVVIVWLVIGFKVRQHVASQAIPDAITYAVATLAVACPCALGLAVPMVLVIAGGIAARRGVIIKSAECTERARKTTDVIFDKTGTITEEKLDVMQHGFFGSEHEAISISKTLVAGNKHPVSLAVAKHLDQYTTLDAAVLEHVHVIPGAGVEAKLGQATLRAGNPTWTLTDGRDAVEPLKHGGMTILVVTRDGEPIAVYGLSTKLRKEATLVIDQLCRRGVTVHLVSGDQKQAVDMVASQAGITRTASQCTPSEKRDYVARLMAEGKTVMFVGDGTNDAVAITQADIGVQLGSVLSASEVSRGAADVVLLGGLEGVLFLIDVSGSSFRRIVFNFAWSAMYNLLAMLLASGAVSKARIPPAYAGLGEIVSVAPVVAAATTMLLRRT